MKAFGSRIFKIYYKLLSILNLTNVYHQSPFPNTHREDLNENGQ